MFGCLRRLGCLGIVLAIAIAAWLLRDRWMPLVFGDRASGSATWAPVTPEGGKEATAALESLGRKNGPVFVNLTAAQFAGILLSGAGGALPTSVHSAEAAVVGDQVRVRASIDLDDIKGLDVLGPFSGFANRRETFELGGTLSIADPGTAQWHVTSARIGQLPIPTAGIPTLLQAVGQGVKTPNASSGAIAFPVPRTVGDVRVARGRITVYRNVP
ncbi:MAG: hypothetical protein MNPFHGCM_00337 [Gemmatimonadaceae bacterium]|nr:hypothetical protein [Gemmatimonadaceae bacterium]